MDIIDQFIARYRREYDFYEQAGRLCQQQLEARLQASGIRSIVTSRAKNPRRLEAKLRQRAASKAYATIDDIYSDIVDLAGVRVALYFPAERREVDKIVKDTFGLATSPKEFTGTSNPSYAKRFSGYWATHYRVQLLQGNLPEASHRYADARIEVQVASVLMHAWAEVEHDLVYKPLQGGLSEDELAILDELNGMVLAGEIALERLQRAAEARVARKDAPFENHYDLASFLLKAASPLLQGDDREPVLGDIELLFELLRRLGLVTPESLKPYLQTLSPDTEVRPVSQQITDQILTADPGRYQTYSEVRAALGTEKSVGTVAAQSTLGEGESHHAALGFFLSQWIIFERFLRALSDFRNIDPRGPAIPTPRMLRQLDILSPAQLGEIEHIRRVRNYLVHGIEVPDAKYIEQYGRALEAMMHQLLDDPRPDVRHAARKALGVEQAYVSPPS